MEYDSNNYEINGTYDAMEHERVESGEYEYDIGEADGNYVQGWMNDILSEYFLNTNKSLLTKLCWVNSITTVFVIKHQALQKNSTNSQIIYEYINFLFLEQHILLRHADLRFH